MNLWKFSPLLLLLGCAGIPAHADDQRPPVRTSPLNCDALSGGTMVCVVNKTRSSIRALQCNGHIWGTTNLSVPGGRIPPGGIAIVNFNHGNCKSGIHIQTSDGQEHDVAGQDVKLTTILNIESDEW